MSIKNEAGSKFSIGILDNISSPKFFDRRLADRVNGRVVRYACDGVPFPYADPLLPQATTPRLSGLVTYTKG